MILVSGLIAGCALDDFWNQNWLFFNSLRQQIGGSAEAVLLAFTSPRHWAVAYFVWSSFMRERRTGIGAQLYVTPISSRTLWSRKVGALAVVLFSAVLAVETLIPTFTGWGGVFSLGEPLRSRLWTSFRIAAVGASVFSLLSPQLCALLLLLLPPPRSAVATILGTTLLLAIVWRLVLWSIVGLSVMATLWPATEPLKLFFRESQFIFLVVPIVLAIPLSLFIAPRYKTLLAEE